MEFSYRDYVAAHGVMPRGKGNWAFSTKRFPNPDEVFWAFGTLTDAKKKAREHFKGAWLVYVLS